MQVIASREGLEGDWERRGECPVLKGKVPRAWSTGQWGREAVGTVDGHAMKSLGPERHPRQQRQ